jgi:hypothetical protein
MLLRAADAPTRHKLEYKYAEGFQRIVLISEEGKPAEAAALEVQTEE